MLSVFFSKSKPINYILTTVSFVGLYVWHFIRKEPSASIAGLNALIYVDRVIFGLVLLLTLLIGHFIIKNNKLDNNNSYAYLINVLLLVIFSDVFYEHRLVLSNLFILLATWNLISSDSFFVSKQRVLNASLCVFVAMLFHFWAILFIIVVFLSILLNFQHDYRRILIPFITLISVSLIYMAVGFFQDDFLLEHIGQQMVYDIDWYYVQTPLDAFLFGFFLILSTLTFISLLFNLADLSKKITESYLKVISILLVGLLVAALTPEKRDSLLIFCLFPVSVMATHFVEKLQKTWARNLFLSLLVLIAFVSYSSYYWESYLTWEIDYDFFEFISKYFISK